MQKVPSQEIKKERKIDHAMRADGFSFAGKSFWTSSKANPKLLEERVKSLKSMKVRLGKENITGAIM